MKTQTTRERLLASTMIGGAALMAFAVTPAVAQESQATEVDTIVVTGSRIVRQDFQAISPVTTVGQEQLELTQTLTVESLLNELPQVVPGNMRTSNNAGGEPFATVDLRGLGVTRNLVLVNGERIPASSTFGTVDLNTIPASLVERVEVVTGGASAVYGSDAISGVVNFILKDDYEGAEFSATYGSSWDGHAPEFEFNALVGGDFANGRGNLTAYASYYQRDPVLQGELDFSRTSGAMCSNAASLSNPYVCDSAAEAQAAIAAGGGVFFSGGSITPPWGLVLNSPGNPFVPGAWSTGPGFVADHDCNPATPNTAYTGGNLSFNNSGDLTRQFSAGACAVPDRAAGSSRYNFAPDNYLIIPAERFGFTTIGTYDITDNVRARVHLNYINTYQEQQLAPTPATNLQINLTPGTQALITANHPDLAAALASRPNPTAPFLMHRRFTEVGTRNSINTNNSFYLLTTLDGRLSPTWDWSLTASYGKNKFDERGLNSVNRTALTQGLASCQDVATGNPLGANALPGCTPLDIYGPGTLDANMQAFLRVNTFSTTEVEEHRVAGFVRGNLFELPAGPVASVFGFEYRESEAGFFVDDQQRTGNIYGFNATQDQQGSVSVRELYTEVSVPLLVNLPYAQYLGLEAGLRYSDYSSIGEVWTHKIGLEFAPTDWLRFRAIHNEATRAPSVFDLFQNGDQGFPGYVDPCNGATGSLATFCTNQTGGALPPAFWAGFNQPNSQVEAFAFGNPNLEPETAETFTAGVVFTPNFFPLGNFRASIDYYDIEITDLIAAFGASFFINSCYNAQDPGNPDCARVVRSPVTGEIDYVNTARGNRGIMATDGWDLQAEWSLDLAEVGLPGRIRVNELFSWTNSLTIDGTEFVDTTFAGIGSATPEWKSVLSVYYNITDWTFMGRWSYTPGMIDDVFGIHPDNRTPEASYVDLSARWNVTDNVALSAFVGNVFDKDPPQTMSGSIFGQGNTDPQTYRVLGRTFSLNARVRF